MSPAEILTASPTLRAAAEQTVAFCAARRITDPVEIMEIMDRTVRRVHAELVETLETRHEEIVEAILRTVWTEIRTEAGLPTD